MIINEDGSVSTADSGRDSNTFNVMSTVNHNKYFANEMKLRLKELKSVVSLSFMNIDLRLITPNKKFKIISTETIVSKAVKNPYRLSSMVTTFNIDGEGFSNITTVVLKTTED